MISGCITHRPQMRLAMLREDYLEICKDDQGMPHKGAALLLNHFEYWHDIKLEQRKKNIEYNAVAEKHGDAPTQDVGLYQFHTATALYESLLGIVGKAAIEDGLKILVREEFISIHKNPNPRYAFDSTKHFLFYPDKVNEALGYPKREDPVTQNRKTVYPKELNGLPKTGRTSPEITPEITSEKETTQPLQAETVIGSSSNSHTLLHHSPTVNSGSKVANPQVREFINWWCQEYIQRFGEQYVVHGGKDGSLVKGLLANASLEKIKRVALTLLDITNDSFYAKNKTIGILSSQWNKLAVYKKIITDKDRLYGGGGFVG